MIHRTILIVLAVIIIIWLAGCAPTPQPVLTQQIDPPRPDLMRQIKDLPPVKVGDEFIQTYSVCRAEYGRTADVARGLQSYVTTIRKQ